MLRSVMYSPAYLPCPAPCSAHHILLLSPAVPCCAAPLPPAHVCRGLCWLFHHPSPTLPLHCPCSSPYATVKPPCPPPITRPHAPNMMCSDVCPSHHLLCNNLLCVLHRCDKRPPSPQKDPLRVLRDCCITAQNAAAVWSPPSTPNPGPSLTCCLLQQHCGGWCLEDEGEATVLQDTK